MGVEDPHAVGQAEPGPGAAVGTRAVPVQGPKHQPLPGLGGGHQNQGLLGVLWVEGRGRETQREMGERDTGRER